MVATCHSFFYFCSSFSYSIHYRIWSVVHITQSYMMRRAFCEWNWWYYTHHITYCSCDEAGAGWVLAWNRRTVNHGYLNTVLKTTATFFSSSKMPFYAKNTILVLRYFCWSIRPPPTPSLLTWSRLSTVWRAAAAAVVAAAAAVAAAVVVAAAAASAAAALTMYSPRRRRKVRRR